MLKMRQYESKELMLRRNRNSREIYEEPKYRSPIPTINEEREALTGAQNPQTTPKHASPSHRNDYTHIWQQPLPHPATSPSDVTDPVAMETMLSGGGRGCQGPRRVNFLRQYYALDKDSIEGNRSDMT